MGETADYTMPGHITKYITDHGYEMPYTAMQGYIEAWSGIWKAKGDFWDYYETDERGNSFKMHRRTIKPAKRVCKEWASLLLDECTQVRTESQECNDWLEDYYERIGFFAHGQELVERAFAQGTGAFALYVSPKDGKMYVRRHYVNMIVPLSWDDDGVTEIALASQVSMQGTRYDQLQMHVLQDDGYHIISVYFDKDGREVSIDGVEPDFCTDSFDPWFAVVRPALANTYVDFSPYGVSVFDDAQDIMKSVDSAYDAFIGEVDLGKLRVFLNDVMIQSETDENGNRVAIPFGKSDATLYRMVDSGDDMVKEFAPSLRTEAQIKAYRGALQMMGDSCGFGLNYFDIDDSGGIKTATEVSSDNSALMRNIKKHENLLRKALQQITRAVLQCARSELGVTLPPEGEITVMFDDSIITDTAAEKAQDMAEVGVTLNAWEYRMKWYNEDEETAKANVPGNAQPDVFDLGEGVLDRPMEKQGVSKPKAGDVREGNIEDAIEGA